MYCEWPEFRRCCLCLPLRKGILVFGYINAIMTVLEIPILLMVEGDNLSGTLLRIKTDELPLLFTAALCVVEVGFNVLLIYGTHTKRPFFIKIYYYFMISMVVASGILEVLSFSMSRYHNPSTIVYFVFCLVINLYLLFLVRSLITKLSVSDGNKFSNQLADFVDGAPVRLDTVYSEIVVPKDDIAV